jgi:hypothetical protein
LLFSCCGSVAALPGLATAMSTWPKQIFRYRTPHTQRAFTTPTERDVRVVQPLGSLADEHGIGGGSEYFGKK